MSDTKPADTLVVEPETPTAQTEPDLVFGARLPEGTPTSPRRQRIDQRFPEIKGYALYPLAILFLLNFVDEFDIHAFSVLTPEIKDAFGMGDTGIAVIRALSGGLVWLATPLVGYLADRWKRTNIVVVGGLFWGVMAFSTGLVPTTVVWVLGIVRFFSGAAKTVNEPVHTTLLSDYYAPAFHGRIYSLHRSANAWAAVLAPAVAGALGELFGWRTTFLVMAIPTFAIVYIALRRLREPVRGGTEDEESAAEAAKEPPVPFGRAVRWLYSVPTLKRIYVGSFFAGCGALSFFTFQAEFLEEEFGLSPFPRGAILAWGGVFSVLGFALGGYLTDKFQRERTLREIARLYGLSVAAIGATLLFYSGAPMLWMIVVLTAVVSVFLGLWFPPYLTIIGFTSPARIRSLGFSYAALFYALGTVGTIIAGQISDSHGIRWAMAFGSVVLAISGFVLASSGRFVNADVARALSVLQTEASLRRERLTAGARSMLVLRDIDVGYDGTQVLFGVALEVKEGEIVALLGTNGAGKSTLLKTVSGLVHPTRGAIFFDGKDIAHLEPEETAELGIIQMPGGKAVFPTLTVKENLDMALWLYGKDDAYAREAMGRALDTFPILRSRIQQQAGSLSGGEQQMLSLAQAFMAKPRLLMIDELSLGLAPLVVQQLLEIVEAIHKSGTTIILVEQSVNIALTVASHAYFMEKGQIRFDGPTDELLRRDDILRSVFLEGARSVVDEATTRDDDSGNGGKG